MSDQSAPRPAGTSPTPPSNGQLPQKKSWIFWLLGGVAAGACICVFGMAAMSMFTLNLMGSRVSQVFTSIESGLGATSVALGTPEGAAAEAAPVFYDPQADAAADIAQALQRAKQENKLVMLDFGADWCPDCIVLSQYFESEAVQPYLNEHFEMVRINVGNWDANLDISKKYGNPIEKGIPAIVLLNAQGKIVESTRAGELANARTITEKEVLDILHQWVEKHS